MNEKLGLHELIGKIEEKKFVVLTEEEYQKVFPFLHNKEIEMIACSCPDFKEPDFEQRNCRCDIDYRDPETKEIRTVAVNLPVKRIIVAKNKKDILTHLFPLFR